MDTTATDARLRLRFERPISLGGTSWCRQIDGGNFNGGSLQAFLRLPGQPESKNPFITLLNSVLYTSGRIAGFNGACAGPELSGESNPTQGWSEQRVCGPVTITLVYKGTSTSFQEWDVTFS